MPRICEFLGIVIGMYWNEEAHHVPHFHAEYGGQFASIAFDGPCSQGRFRLGSCDWFAVGQASISQSWRPIGSAPGGGMPC